jgi:hypothetical protein
LSNLGNGLRVVWGLNEWTDLCRCHGVRAPGLETLDQRQDQRQGVRARDRASGPETGPWTVQGPESSEADDQRQAPGPGPGGDRGGYLRIFQVSSKSQDLLRVSEVSPKGLLRVLLRDPLGIPRERVSEGSPKGLLRVLQRESLGIPRGRAGGVTASGPSLRSILVFTAFAVFTVFAHSLPQSSFSSQTAAP